MPADALSVLEQHDAIYFGAVGHPDVPDHVSLWELLIPIRQGLDLYVNLRPVRVLDGIASPLRNGTPATVDMLCIRENTEGEYTNIGGRFHQGAPDESAVQTSVYTRKGVERIVRYAFERARERKKTLASATKIAGKGVVNPMAAVWSASLLLDHLGEREAGALLMRALESVARTGPHTADIGGRASTAEVGAAIVAAIGR